MKLMLVLEDYGNNVSITIYAQLLSPPHINTEVDLTGRKIFLFSWSLARPSSVEILMMMMLNMIRIRSNMLKLVRKFETFSSLFLMLSILIGIFLENCV